MRTTIEDMPTLGEKYHNEILAGDISHWSNDGVIDNLICFRYWSEEGKVLYEEAIKRGIEQADWYYLFDGEEEE